MKKYHITDDGPKPCSAQEGKCPITKNTHEKHYTDINIANRVYEENMKEKEIHSISKIFGLSPVNKGLPQVEVRSSLQPKKGGSYYGLTIPEDYVQKHLQSWREEIGDKKTAKMEQAKIDRDGDYSFHITALSPKEVRQLKKSGAKIDLDDFTVKFTGIGSVKDGEKEAWFITAESSEIDEYRNQLGLPKHNLHITIGFINGDVHNKPKDNTSLKII